MNTLNIEVKFLRQMKSIKIILVSDEDLDPRFDDFNYDAYYKLFVDMLPESISLVSNAFCEWYGIDTSI